LTWRFCRVFEGVIFGADVRESLIKSPCCHALLLNDSPGIAMFDLVDEDEGQLLVQRTAHATSVLKKK
jgi:hypothetical protein